MAVWGLSGEPNDTLFAGYTDELLGWFRRWGKRADGLLVSVITEPSRHDDIKDFVFGLNAGSQELAAALRQLEEATLVFTTSAGVEIERHSMTPRQEFRTIQGPATTEDGTQMRSRARFVDGQYRDPAWVEKWTGTRWIAAGPGYIAVPERRKGGWASRGGWKRSGSRGGRHGGR